MRVKGVHGPESDLQNLGQCGPGELSEMEEMSCSSPCPWWPLAHMATEHMK